MTAESWMLEGYAWGRVQPYGLLFLPLDRNCQMFVIVGKLTDDFLCGGENEEIRMFMIALEKHFTVGKITIKQSLEVGGSEV